MAGRNFTDMRADNITGMAESQTSFPLSSSSNNQVPEFLYKQFPVTSLLIGVVLNLFLIYYIIASKKYESPLFTFIASLAITDFLSCLGLAGWAGLLYPTIIFPYPTLACKGLLFVGGIGISGSAYHLAFFSCLRYYQLCYPLHARANVTRTFVLKLCIGIWLVTVAAYTILAIYYYSINVLHDGKLLQLCAFSGSVLVRDWCYLVITTIMPCCVILTLHILKYVQLLCQTKQIDVHQDRQNADARAVAIVIILFFISWIPLNTYAVIRTNTTVKGPYQDKLFLSLMYMIGYNSTFNPVVYMIAVQSIRNDIQSFLCAGQKHARG